MDRVTRHVLALRESPAASALRRGESPATQRYAYPHLAALWSNQPYLRTPMLRFAALAASARRTPQVDGLGLARHLRQLVDRPGGVGESGVERRLLVATGGDVDHLHRLLRGLLTTPASATIGLDFDDVWKVYRNWDHRIRDARDRTRDRLVESFYQPLATDPDPNNVDTDSPGDRP